MLYQAADTVGINNERISIVLGLVTLLFILTTFASCRTCFSWLTLLGVKNLLKSKGYQTFSKYHSVYWWLFGVAIVSHVFIAIGHTGFPQIGDPDAGAHWIILIPGFVGALSSLTIFSSCRAFPRLIAPTTSRFSLTGKTYRTFFKYHAYYWLVLWALITLHFTAGYLHAGLWP